MQVDIPFSETQELEIKKGHKQISTAAVNNGNERSVSYRVNLL